MIYLIINLFTQEKFEFTENDLTGATAKLAEIKEQVLIEQSYRFTIIKETVDGNDTVWSNADLDNDPEDYTYQIFNHNIGQHEKINSLSQAKARILELKEQFADSLGLNTTPTLTEPVIKTTNTQNL
jgi:hypothetical protein